MAPAGHVTLLEFDGMPHTPLANDATFCGWVILVRFLLSANWVVDRTCLDDGHLPPAIDFAGAAAATKALALQYMGTTDLWGDNETIAG